MAREHETETRQSQPETTEAPPAATSTGSTSFSSSGPIPTTDTTASTAQAPTASQQAFGAQPQGGPEIGATQEALGAHMVDGMNNINNVGPNSPGNDLNHGVHYWYNYQRHCQKAGKPELWQDKWRSGHTQSTSFINPHEKGRWMDWELKKGESASRGIKEWLAGATVAECLSAVIALEIDTLRAAIGDKKFDKMFGSADEKEDRAIPAHQRMHVKAGMVGTPVQNYIHATKVAEEAQSNGGQFGEVEEAKLDKELIPGQWYYFYNHPKYLLKHPGGAWQGENALYMGKNAAGERTWAGMGASGMTEDAMIDEMVGAYNQPRNDYDNRMLKEQGLLQADGKFSDPIYDPKSGTFPDTVDRQQILSSQVYAIGNTERKGGFLATAGMELDAKKVQKTRDHE